MKTLQICVPTGILFTIVLLMLAFNTNSTIEYRYDRCLNNLMENYGIATEAAALDQFEDLAVAKAKILEADQLLDQVNRIGEGPVVSTTHRSLKDERTYARQLQFEAKQLIVQLEQLGLASN